jgi:hypothetical protein
MIIAVLLTDKHRDPMTEAFGQYVGQRRTQESNSDAKTTH